MSREILIAGGGLLFIVFLSYVTVRVFCLLIKNHRGKEQ